jgi:predicted alpha/beta-hydrolase family hydrolase
VPDVVLLPGYGGTARQPALIRLDAALAARGLTAKPITLKPAKATPELSAQVEDLQQYPARAYAGRSFGGRVAIRLALQQPPEALVLLAFPVRPEGKRRLLDEKALREVSCPTLVVQGSDDELGSAALVKRLAKKNRNVSVYVLEGVGHGWGKLERAGLEVAADWLAQRLTRM